jgi:putative ABC transport system substrate-binding protein
MHGIDDALEITKGSWAEGEPPDPFLISRSEQLVALAARHVMPAIYPARTFADLGRLMSYGSNVLDPDKQAGIYVGKILKGAKPADLPIQQKH